MPAPPISVEELTAVTDEILAALNTLVSQLSTSAAPLTLERAAQITASPTTQLLVARDANGDVVGMLTLAVFALPTGVRAWIEDVVVDEGARGKGIGEALALEALNRAFAAGARTVDLTSRPTRTAANRLYERLGFGRRETNVYRYVSDAT